MARVTLFPTCVIEALAPDVGASVIRVLRARGHDVHIPDDATCCGQPAWNAGQADAAATVARTTLQALDEDDGDVIVVPAGSCASMIRVYWPELFRSAGDSESVKRAVAVGERTREFTEFLSATTEPEARDDVPESADTVAYHHSCHMLRELHLEEEPRDALSAAGFQLADWRLDQLCCGFGGTFALKLPEVSTAIADEKIDALPEGISCVAGSDMSCLIHLRSRMEHRSIDTPVRHTAELLDQ